MDFIQNMNRDVNVPAGVFLRELFATFKKGGLDKTAVWEADPAAMSVCPI